MIQARFKYLLPLHAFEIACLASLVFVLSGCGGSVSNSPQEKAAENPSAQSVNPTFTGVKLKVVSLDNPALAQVAADLVGEWQASRQADVEIVEYRQEQGGGEPPADVDVYLIRADRLGELIDKDSIAPLEGIEADWASRPPVFDEQVSRYGPARFAVPLGTSVLVLAYRESVVNDPEIKAEAEKLGVSFPPNTWDEFDKYVGLLSKRMKTPLALPSTDSPEDRLLTEIFLARATSLGKHRDYYSFLFGIDDGKPRIASKPFVESLESLVRIRSDVKFTPKEARSAFRDGQAALLIDDAVNVAEWAGQEEASRIGVAPLPGSPRVFDPDRQEYAKSSPANLSAYLPEGGGYLAVMAKGRSARNAEAARDFLIYLSGESTAAQWATDRRMLMLPTRDALLAVGFVDPRIAPRVSGGAWGEAILKQIGNSNYVVGLRIPQSRSFIDDLAQGVNAAFEGASAGESLNKVSAEWTARIEAFGPQRMKWHYARSLVKPLTDSEPPAPGK